MTGSGQEISRESAGGEDQKETDWVQVTLTGPVPALDAFADFMNSMGAAGAVFSEDPEKRAEIEVVSSFLPRGEHLEANLEDIRKFTRSLQELWPDSRVLKLDAEAVIERDWLREWKKLLKPLKAGSRIWIVPTWLEPPDEAREEGMILIRLDPGMAFGTGLHATTRRCMELVENLVPGTCRSLLDVGTGTGILAMVAAKMGSKRVVAIDVDKQAVRVAEENIKRNRISSKVKIYHKRAGGAASPRWKKFDLIAANLYSQEVMRILEYLHKLLINRGKIILGGIMKDQEQGVLDLYFSGGFSLVERYNDYGWITLLMEKN
jgi:ribosomal protein L11 methyltransferase